MVRQAVLDYVKKRYGIRPDYPWQKYVSHAVLRHNDNNKWFALVMKVSRDKLGLSGTGEVDVINLKIDDFYFRDVLIREDGVMPAYHMNKANWITVLLDGKMGFERLCDLIDMNFMATASAKKKERFRPAKEWIIPANPKFYDIEHAFDDAEEIDWKQGSGIKVGDIVFMYVAAPVSAILYKCKVKETDIPYEYEDKNLSIKALMRIKLLKRYTPDQFAFDVLKSEYGIFAIRGPRGVPNSLSSALK